jgi:hypothetical protein
VVRAVAFNPMPDSACSLTGSVAGQGLSCVPGFNTRNLCLEPPRFRPWFRSERALTLCAIFC